MTPSAPDMAVGVRVSVIVPVYNSDEFVRHTVETLLQQDFEDFEVLLMDDGSSDSSGSICDDMAAHDKRVRVFHLENGGMCRARNLGIEYARGEYVSFCDNDDECLPGFLSANFNLAYRYGVDCVRFGRRHDLIMGGRVCRTDVLCPSKEEVLWGDDVVEHYDTVMTAGSGIWTGMYRRSTILENGIKFDERLRSGYEDHIFNARFMEVANGVALNPSVLYVWSQRASHSASMKIRDDYFLGLRLAALAETRLLDRNGFSGRRPDIYAKCMCFYLHNGLSISSKSGASVSLEANRPFYESLRQTFCESGVHRLDEKCLRPRDRLAYHLLWSGRYRVLHLACMVVYGAKYRLRHPHV